MRTHKILIYCVKLDHALYSINYGMLADQAQNSSLGLGYWEGWKSGGDTHNPRICRNERT